MPGGKSRCLATVEKGGSSPSAFFRKIHWQNYLILRVKLPIFLVGIPAEINNRSFFSIVLCLA